MVGLPRYRTAWRAVKRTVLAADVPAARSTAARPPDLRGARHEYELGKVTLQTLPRGDRPPQPEWSSVPLYPYLAGYVRYGVGALRPKYML